MITSHDSRKYQRSFLKEEWPVLFSLVAISILYSMLAESMANILPFPIGFPITLRIISLTLGGMLVLITVVAGLLGKIQIARGATIFFSSIVTVYLISGVTLLVASLPSLGGSQGGLILLRDAAIVWIINVLIFAIWFWIIDGGGPAKRRNAQPTRKDFLFPQEAIKIPGWEQWQPNYTSYLFIAFHNCSTFGPTDTYVLSNRGKLFVTIQVIISLITLTMFVARALTIVS